jgi:RNA polymerase-interacting CarD/CdnL/TRCF family regulator
LNNQQKKEFAMKSGKILVYPPYGVVVVENQYHMSEGVACELRLRSSQTTVFTVPLRNFQRNGIRKLSGRKDVIQAKSILARSKREKPAQNWKQTQEIQRQILRKGELCGLAQVVNELTLRDQENAIGYFDREILKSVLNFMVEEFSAIEGKQMAEVESDIMSALQRAIEASTFGHRRAHAFTVREMRVDGEQTIQRDEDEVLHDCARAASAGSVDGD